MSTYKIIQDIEAEDQILGPLTLRQFIYSLIASFSLYMCFIGFTKHVWPVIAIFSPIALFTGFFAFPFGKDQPTEVWALAKIRFLFKPRRRIWDQSGLTELVTITVPKKLEKVYTDGLSQTEVRSRLHALADTIDSRGWAIKNVNLNMYVQPFLNTGTTDRLIDINNIPQSVPDFDVQASDDILDEQSNPIAQQFTQMIGASSTAHRQQLIDELNGVRAAASKTQPTSPADYWFLNQTPVPQNIPSDSGAFSDPKVISPGTDAGLPAVPITSEEAALLAHMKQQGNDQAESYAHLRTIQPLGAEAKDQANAQSLNLPPTPSSHPMSVSGSASTDPAILGLASNNDLNVATLARQAHRARNPDEPEDGEVVISLR